MVKPLNLIDTGDEKFTGICINHVNKGLLKGVDYVLTEYRVFENYHEYFRKLFPRGVVTDFVGEVYRIRDIITSRMLYVLGDYDKFVVMNMLNRYCNAGEVRKYTVEEADRVATGAFPSYRNFNLFGQCRIYIKEVVKAYADLNSESFSKIMCSLEDLRHYMGLCFLSTDFLCLEEFSREELEALSTMEGYSHVDFSVSKTRLYMPYTVIK